MIKHFLFVFGSLNARSCFKIISHFLFVFGGVNARVCLWRPQDHLQRLALLPCRSHGSASSGLSEERASAFPRQAIWLTTGCLHRQRQLAHRHPGGGGTWVCGCNWLYLSTVGSKHWTQASRLALEHVDNKMSPDRVLIIYDEKLPKQLLQHSSFTSGKLFPSDMSFVVEDSLCRPG